MPGDRKGLLTNYTTATAFAVSLQMVVERHALVGRMQTNDVYGQTKEEDFRGDGRV